MYKLLATAAIGATLFAAPALAHDQAEAQAAVEAFAANYIKLYNTKDAAGIEALFADDGLEVPPLPMVTGRANIEALCKSILDRGAKDLHYDIKYVQTNGELVYAVGEFTVNLPRPDGAGLQPIQGNFVNVYQWDDSSAGKLKYKVHSYNFRPPTQ